ncbi:ATP/GTP-binding protein [Streptomyces sp. NRRL_B-2557]|uniref:ATP/GTP-binding protein n=1 Tax=Streptomyces sp. NRRL_B-2557 TaxID=3028698 RepID=UPI0029B47F82|nr:ATP/GTP-binding protein [Streptomyces sp. NRRL_B-2557]MDX2748350.1 ATP/GTP-binding protein [Streptomyces sp. NRRL_B-2557]
MLRRAAAAAVVVLAGVLVPAAHADGGQTGGICEGTALTITVCASDGGAGPGAGGGTAAAPAGTSGGSSTPSCTYTKLEPQPPPDNAYWKGHDRSEEGAVYGVHCPGQQGARTVWIADGKAPAAAPVIDPEALARRAAASMRLDGPKVAGPRAAGTYVVGMPMWMWATPSTSTFGPVSASATAGGVTVTATAEVTRVRWSMGDGATVTCRGPGTPYRKSREVTESPDCGHLYERPSYEEPDGRYRGTATSTWTITWSAPALGDGGTFTEARQTPFTVDVREVQVVNTR